MKTAQDIINEAQKERGWTQNQYLKQFYPELYQHELAERQLSGVVGK